MLSRLAAMQSAGSGNGSGGFSFGQQHLQHMDQPPAPLSSPHMVTTSPHQAAFDFQQAAFQHQLALLRGGPMRSLSPKKYRRPRACERCNMKKIKCSTEKPCQACTTAGVQCVARLDYRKSDNACSECHKKKTRCVFLRGQTMCQRCRKYNLTDCSLWNGKSASSPVSVGQRPKSSIMEDGTSPSDGTIRDTSATGSENDMSALNIVEKALEDLSNSSAPNPRLARGLAFVCRALFSENRCGDLARKDAQLRDAMSIQPETVVQPRSTSAAEFGLEIIFEDDKTVHRITNSMQRLLQCNSTCELEDVALRPFRLFHVNDIGKQVADLLDLVRQPHRPRKPTPTPLPKPKPRGDADASKSASASQPPVNLAEQAAEKVESQVRVFLAAREEAAAEVHRPQSGDSTDAVPSPTPAPQHREPSLGNDAKFVHCHQTLSRHMLDDGVRMRSLIYSWAPQRAGFGGPAVTAADFPPPPSQQPQIQPPQNRDSRQSSSSRSRSEAPSGAPPNPMLRPPVPMPTGAHHLSVPMPVSASAAAAHPLNMIDNIPVPEMIHGMVMNDLQKAAYKEAYIRTFIEQSAATLHAATPLPSPVARYDPPQPQQQPQMTPLEGSSPMEVVDALPAHMMNALHSLASSGVLGSNPDETLAEMVSSGQWPNLTSVLAYMHNAADSRPPPPDESASYAPTPLTSAPVSPTAHSTTASASSPQQPPVLTEEQQNLARYLASFGSTSDNPSESISHQATGMDPYNTHHSASNHGYASPQAGSHLSSPRAAAPDNDVHMSSPQSAQIVKHDQDYASLKNTKLAKHDQDYSSMKNTKLFPSEDFSSPPTTNFSSQADASMAHHRHLSNPPPAKHGAHSLHAATKRADFKPVTHDSPPSASPGGSGSGGAAPLDADELSSLLAAVAATSAPPNSGSGSGSGSTRGSGSGGDAFHQLNLLAHLGSGGTHSPSRRRPSGTANTPSISAPNNKFLPSSAGSDRRRSSLLHLNVAHTDPRDVISTFTPIPFNPSPMPTGGVGASATSGTGGVGMSATTLEQLRSMLSSPALCEHFSAASSWRSHSPASHSHSPASAEDSATHNGSGAAPMVDDMPPFGSFMPPPKQ